VAGSVDALRRPPFPPERPCHDNGTLLGQKTAFFLRDACAREHLPFSAGTAVKGAAMRPAALRREGQSEKTQDTYTQRASPSHKSAAQESPPTAPIRWDPMSSRVVNVPKAAPSGQARSRQYSWSRTQDIGPPHLLRTVPPDERRRFPSAQRPPRARRHRPEGRSPRRSGRSCVPVRRRGHGSKAMRSASEGPSLVRRTAFDRLANPEPGPTSQFIPQG
jgi:hypothetical protein